MQEERDREENRYYGIGIIPALKWIGALLCIMLQNVHAYPHFYQKFSL